MTLKEIVSTRIKLNTIIIPVVKVVTKVISQKIVIVCAAVINVVTVAMQSRQRYCHRHVGILLARQCYHAVPSPEYK